MGGDGGPVQHPRTPRRSTWIAAGVVAALVGIGAVGNLLGDEAPEAVVPADTSAAASTAATPADSTAAGATTTPTAPPTDATPDPPTTDAPPAVAPTTVAPTTSSTTTVPVGGALLALDVLGTVRVENEHRRGYVRDFFGYPADLDGDGCNTRAEVLQAEASGLVQIDTPGCLVREGDWVSLYDGLAVTDAAELEIDHVVALKEAWDSGAWRWDPLTLVAFGNDVSDTRTLRAVTSTTNRSKSDKDPSNWLPPAPSAVCEYLGDWVAVKARWSLTMDQSEYGRIRNVLRGDCAGTTIAPIDPVSAARGYLDRPFAPTPTEPPVVPGSGGGGSTDVYYENCSAARAAGAAPLYRGDPGYRDGLDRDDDGVACEG